MNAKQAIYAVRTLVRKGLDHVEISLELGVSAAEIKEVYWYETYQHPAQIDIHGKEFCEAMRKGLGLA